MSRRRFVTARELADELGVDLTEVLSRVSAGGLRLMAPPRAETTAARERGGGLDLLGQYQPNDVLDWLRVYFRENRIEQGAQYARDHGLPYSSNGRVYVQPKAIVDRVRGRFYPNPTYKRMTDELRRIHAQRGTALGADRAQPAGRLIWWRLPPAILQEVMPQ